ncbi:MAG: fumarylacetoacetate hydrolase family protein [Candidatus Marinimicrobia bacterium]|jgi:fumarylacetoacetate (FAA) hydrolase|nr:fumarylacetoacetate hydrolase family protein [Candidatus Neomarinimicrobiota bacterium]
MKFVTYKTNNLNENRFGYISGDRIIDIQRTIQFLNEDNKSNNYLQIPDTLMESLSNWDTNFQLFQEIQNKMKNFEKEDLKNKNISLNIDNVQLLPPVTNPPSFRDFYAFEQHVRAARKLRGLDMHPDWFRLPIFYFSNPNALYGHGEEIPFPQNTNELDFELEFAIIIANGGRNVKKDGADNLIAGYTICNDWSARDLQREEMALSLGPAKGKDFATSFGPCMITLDELENDWDENGKLHLRMTCHVNGKLVSDGNTNDLYHPFTSMIERASMNTNLVAGDYIGSGTVGTGCILELRPENVGGWIKKGDVVRMEVEKLGVLENKIV